MSLEIKLLVPVVRNPDGAETGGTFFPNIYLLAVYERDRKVVIKEGTTLWQSEMWPNKLLFLPADLEAPMIVEKEFVESVRDLDSGAVKYTIHEKPA